MDEKGKVKILKVGGNITFQIQLKVLRAFADQEDGIYYIVASTKKRFPIVNTQQVVWGVLRLDGTYDKIPQHVLARAGRLVVKENLLQGLE